jgi:glycosyltransferase involved in cell wall biosynthesis
MKVSVGVPVFNGAASLSTALNNILDQTVRDIEIIISDNASTDATAEICRDITSRDPRIRYFRQPQTINATENFRFVLSQARAPYFMWAAHDDTRDLDYIEKLLRALEDNPNAVLAFGDVRAGLGNLDRPIGGVSA